MLGQTPTYPLLYNLLEEMDSGQVQEEFSLATNEYEIKSFEKGLNLIFNQNFVLKKIQFYDSGYLYTGFDDTLPNQISFDMNYSDLKNYKYDTYTADTFNPYIYHKDFGSSHIKLYCKGKGLELVKVTAHDTFLNSQDVRLRAEWGMRIIPNGKCISGNCFNGSGVMQWPDGLKYEGQWMSGIPHGRGNFADTNGLSYAGDFKLGFLWDEGVLQVPNQSLYEGNFVLGRKMGHGYATFANGTRYDGEGNRDLMHGQGHFWFSDSYHYRGEFVSNQFNGKGKLISPEGYVEGSFMNGKPHGQCTQMVTRGQISLTGTWINGKKEGSFDLHNPVTGTVKVYFENDIEMK